MANLKPWYKVVTPREDLRESKPLDASEFAVHLDQVRDGRAPTVYRNADEFLDRTYLTRSLLELAGQVVRRLSGEKTETSAVFNLATQFGGGKLILRGAALESRAPVQLDRELTFLPTFGRCEARWLRALEALQRRGVSFPVGRTCSVPS